MRAKGAEMVGSVSCEEGQTAVRMGMESILKAQVLCRGYQGASSEKGEVRFGRWESGSSGARVCSLLGELSRGWAGVHMRTW